MQEEGKIGNNIFNGHLYAHIHIFTLKYVCMCTQGRLWAMRALTVNFSIKNISLVIQIQRDYHITLLLGGSHTKCHNAATRRTAYHRNPAACRGILCGTQRQWQRQRQRQRRQLFRVDIVWAFQLFIVFMHSQYLFLPSLPFPFVFSLFFSLFIFLYILCVCFVMRKSAMQTIL